MSDYRTDIPVLANGVMYFTCPGTGHLKNLCSISFDGKTTKTIVKNATEIRGLMADENGVYFLHQAKSSTDNYIQKVTKSGKVESLVKLTFSDDERWNLYCVSDGYLYYANEAVLYRISTDGTDNEPFFEKSQLGIIDNISEVFVDGDLMLLQFYHERPKETYCVKLDGSYALNLGRYCFTDFDISSDAVYYHVVTLPGDDADDYSFCRESVYRKLDLPLKQYK